MLYPQARYTVSVLKSPTRSKISIGSNPWNPDAAEDNLASLAEQYGGGGHPRVAAISLDPGDLERAKQVAQDIAEKLRRDARFYFFGPPQAVWNNPRVVVK